MGIIRQIYNNDYYPADETGINDRGYREATARMNQEYERFRDALAEAQRPELEKLMELHLDALVFGCEAAFIQGARDGARMLDVVGFIARRLKVSFAVFGVIHF